MEGHGLVQPVGRPAVAAGELRDDIGEPSRPFAEFSDVNILCRESEVAGQHQRAAAVDREIEPRAVRDGADLVEGGEQGEAVEDFTHHAERLRNAIAFLTFRLPVDIFE